MVMEEEGMIARRYKLMAASLVSGVVLASLVACGSDEGSSKATEVELGDFYFRPNSLTIKSGDKASFELENEGKLEHTLTIKDLNVDVTVGAGKKTTVTVQGSKTGTFDLVCRFHGQSNNMTGKATVQ